jgi:hypothetical protein
MREPRRNRDLADESHRTDRCAVLRRENLYGNFASMFPLLREVDDRHAAFAEDALNRVALRERGRKRRSAARRSGQPRSHAPRGDVSGLARRHSFTRATLVATIRPPSSVYPVLTRRVA